MFTDQFVQNKERAVGALELAMRAREHQKEMALLAGFYRAEKPARDKSKKSFFKVLLTGLFTGM